MNRINVLDICFGAVVVVQLILFVALFWAMATGANTADVTTTAVTNEAECLP